MKRLTILTLLTLLITGGCSLSPPQQAAPESAPTADPTAAAVAPQGSDTAQGAGATALPPLPMQNGLVVADGRVVPVRSLEASFQVPGVVSEILVQEGDHVAKGDPLMRLSQEQLSLAVDEARATLTEARAIYAQLTEGATDDERTIAQARLDQARARLRSTTGEVVPEDVAAVEAELTALRAELASLQSGPRPAELKEAQARITEAEAALEGTRDRYATDKFLAKGEMEQAATTLQLRQDEYSKLYWELRNVDRDRQLTPDEVSAENRALAELKLAEISLEQAKVAYENALQQEVNQIAVATARLDAARAQLEQLLAPAETDAIEKVRARIAAAEARLKELQGDQRQGDLQASEADVTIAAASLDRIQAGPRQAELANAEARIVRAEVGLKRAELAVTQATLRAPIDGVVGQISTAVGETVSAQAAPVITIADTSGWMIQTANLNELAVVAVREGDPATVTFYALPGYQLSGTVKRIMPVGSSVGRDTVYTVVIEPDTWDDRLRWNMSASVRITPQ